MKTKALFFALLIAVSTATFGNDTPSMAVVSSKGSEVFKVIYKGTGAGKVKLNILNATGKVIHSETISSVDGFILPVNFRGLESGNYTIELIDNVATYKEDITYKPASDLKTIHVSKLVSAEGKFLLAVANVHDEPIRVSIYDQFHRLLYNESKTVSGDFAQVFRMANPAGHYTFEVSDSAGNRKYFNF